MERYDHLPTSGAFRRSIRAELIGMGFTGESDKGCDFYGKSSGGLFPIRAYVFLYSDGKALATAARRKWPQFNADDQ